MIVKRRVDFEFDPQVVPRAWANDDLHVTTFCHALSVLFPEGERFFIDSVRHYARNIEDPKLRAEIDAFIAQEAMHGRDHRVFNRMIEGRGLTTAPVIETRLRRALKAVRKRFPPIVPLAVTCGLEHFTSILAEQLLMDDRLRDDMHETVRPLWMWHALEESEHKAVAFDVYEAVGGTYPVRAGVMVVTSVLFSFALLHVHARFLEQEGALGDVRGWARAIGYLWGKPGPFRKLLLPYLDYYRPGFHPNDHGSEALLDEWRERLFGQAGTMREFLRAA